MNHPPARMATGFSVAGLCRTLAAVTCLAALVLPDRSVQGAETNAPESAQEAIMLIQEQARPPARFAQHIPQFHAQRRTMAVAGGPKTRDLVVVFDGERAVGIWGQGKRQWDRRFHLLTHRPGQGLDAAGLAAHLKRHLCSFGYDALWAEDGLAFSVGPWVPSAEFEPERIETILGPAGTTWEAQEWISLGPEAGSQHARLMLHCDPVHGYVAEVTVSLDLAGEMAAKRKGLMLFTPTIASIQDAWPGRSHHVATVWTTPRDVGPTGQQFPTFCGYPLNAAAVRGRQADVGPGGCALFLTPDRTDGEDGPWSTCVTSSGRFGFGPCPLMLEATIGMPAPPLVGGRLQYHQRFTYHAIPPEMSRRIWKTCVLSGVDERTIQSFARLGIAVNPQQPQAILLPLGVLEDFTHQPRDMTTFQRGIITPGRIEAQTGRDGGPCLRIDRTMTLADSPLYPKIRLAPSSRYRLRAWAKATHPEASAALSVETVAYHPDGLRTKHPGPVLGPDWQPIEIRFATGRDDLATEAMICCEVAKGGGMLLDDFMLERLDENTTPTQP